MIRIMAEWRAVLLCLLAAGGVQAETGRSAWLRYAALEEVSAQQYRATLPAAIVALGDAAPVLSAREEIASGVRGMLGRTLRYEAAVPREGALVVGTLERVRQVFPQLDLPGALAFDGYWLKTVRAGSLRHTVITGSNGRGVLYGAFAYLPVEREGS